MDKTGTALTIIALLKTVSTLEKSNNEMITELKNVKELARHPDKMVREFHSKKAKEVAKEIKNNKDEIKKIKKDIEDLKKTQK